MKKILVALMMTAAAWSLNAQNPAVEIQVYADLEPFYTNVMGMNKNVSVRIDLGQFQSESKNYTIQDDNGKDMKFNSIVGMLNYMGERGWQLVQVYRDTDNQDHWIMSKTVTDKSQATEGLKIKNFKN